jgi:ABC-type lipoprotein export system ATPase subunit/GNAT superfamily N-acetyltransferase
VKVDVAVSCTPSTTIRAEQVSAAYDVPASERHTLRWTTELPLDEREWNVGLIVGPSGAGKTTILRECFGEPEPLSWGRSSVIDDFPDVDLESIVAVCGAVGFNTIPAWLRPYEHLSNGERFRVELARRLIEPRDVIVMDEFTSVVDRQVAKIGAHAVAKHVRREGRRFIAATCHHDVIDWLQPDWVLEPTKARDVDADTGDAFTWRSLHRRPDIACRIERVPFSYWRLFAPFHYLTAHLHPNARVYVLFAEDEPAACAGILPRPSRFAGRNYGISRLVTLPDWQGLGLAFALIDRVGAAYAAKACMMRGYPAHPALIRAMDRSPVWALEIAPKVGSVVRGPHSSLPENWHQGARPNATFRYVGPRMSVADAHCLIDGQPG